jgi:hypothetical protein
MIVSTLSFLLGLGLKFLEALAKVFKNFLQ